MNESNWKIGRRQRDSKAVHIVSGKRLITENNSGNLIPKPLNRKI